MLLGSHSESARYRRCMPALSFEDTRNAMQSLPAKPA